MALSPTRAAPGSGDAENAHAPRAATITDVARAAGVSTTTVSHVMNSSRRVADETRRAVEHAIGFLNYRPSVLARALAGSQTQTAGIIVSAGSNPYFSDIVFSVVRECARLGLAPMLADSQDDLEVELKAVRMLHERRVDGLIMVPLGGVDSPGLAYVRDNRIPAVLVDQLVDDRFDQVGLRNKDAARTATEHLLDRGHRRIAFIGGHPKAASTAERVEGYRAALSGAGIEHDPALLRDGARDISAVRLIADELLAAPDRPTACLGANNLATIGTMQVARGRRLRIPEELSYVGIDDFEWADAFEPRLTAVSQPCELIGQNAAAFLSRRIRTPSLRSRTLRLEPTLIVRSSAGPPVSRERLIQEQTALSKKEETECPRFA